KQGEIQLSEEPLAPAGPIIVNDTLVVSSQDTNVYMLPISEVTAGDAGADSSNAAQASDASDAGAPWGWIGGGIGAVVIILVLAGVILMRKQRRRTCSARIPYDDTGLRLLSMALPCGWSCCPCPWC